LGLDVRRQENTFRQFERKLLSIKNKKPRQRRRGFPYR
jgi:hypothetical protein